MGADGVNCSLLALLSDKGGVEGVAQLATSPELNWETWRECLDRLPDEGVERRELLVLPPIFERLAKALEVFSRANVAKERRERRETEPTTEPENVVVVVVEGGSAREAEGGSEVLSVGGGAATTEEPEAVEEVGRGGSTGEETG